MENEALQHKVKVAVEAARKWVDNSAVRTIFIFIRGFEQDD